MEIISQVDAAAAGLRHYFTGKPCVHGHTAKRYVSIGTCTVCAKGYALAKSQMLRNVRRAKAMGGAYYLVRGTPEQMAACKLLCESVGAEWREPVKPNFGPTSTEPFVFPAHLTKPWEPPANAPAPELRPGETLTMPGSMLR